jgi:hypothetical protein
MADPRKDYVNCHVMMSLSICDLVENDDSLVTLPAFAEAKLQLRAGRRQAEGDS